MIIRLAEAPGNSWLPWAVPGIENAYSDNEFIHINDIKRLEWDFILSCRSIDLPLFNILVYTLRKKKIKNKSARHTLRVTTGLP